MLRNKKLSNRNTYVSLVVSKLAHHGESIGQGKFEKVYFPNMELACCRAESFASSFEGVVASVGTMLPEFIKEITKLASRG